MLHPLDRRYSPRFGLQIKTKLVRAPDSASVCLMADTGIVSIEETKTKETLDTPWNVIVLNDPINLMSYVTMVFQRVFGYPRERAERLMLEVHHRGRSLVWSGGREQAEHYVHQLHSYQLLAHMEKSS
jgi:ATP-dependent Clp protease adaptor protein ClpS